MAKVFVSSVVNAGADVVWQTIRDFNSLAEWHPAIRDSEIEDGLTGDRLGCVRSFHLHDGSHLREQLTGLSDHQRHMSYIMLDSPLPVTNYVAGVRVLPVTDGGRSYVEWTARFDVPPEHAAQTIDLVANDVFQAGFNQLKVSLDGAR